MMRFSAITGRRKIAALAVLLCLLVLLPASTLAIHPASSPDRALETAWELAHATGAYRFTTEIDQTTYPALTVTNTGRGPRQEQFHLEGGVDLLARSMNMKLWKGEGSVMAPGSGFEIRMEGDQGFGRPAGGQWQAINDVSGGFAPGNDHLAYLAAATNVRELGAESRAVPQGDGSEGLVTYYRYAFDLDGPQFARYMRDRLENYLRERGELPLGMSLDTPRQYLEMTGSGEVWLDSRGLPLRLTMQLEYPEQADGERVRAELTTDFSDYSPLQAAATGTSSGDQPLIRALPAQAKAALGQAARAGLGQRAALSGAFVTVMLALLWLAMRGRGSRQIQTILALLVIVSMLVVPLIQAERVQAAGQRLAERQDLQETRAREAEAARGLEEQLAATDWAPNRNPLPDPASLPAADSTVRASFPSFAPEPAAVPLEETTDLDQDGLTQAQEEALGTSDADIDFDNDGLTDGQEIMQLGTEPLEADTDGDGLGDYVEVTGFVDAHGVQWYTDPSNIDTNNDGQLDTTECHERVSACLDLDVPNDGIQPDECPALTALACSDSDDDGTPDIFDLDNDGDGVPDKKDLAPNSLVDRTGYLTKASSIQAFDRDNPFRLKVDNLGTDLPVFVDLQLRPINDAHLTYALNVLDWPSGDTEGQIQRVKDTTFATTDNLAAQNDQDPRNATGDMRLIPMLEIEIDEANGVPLPLTQPVIDVPVQGVISGSLYLEQGAGAIELTPHLAPAGPYDMDIYAGSCAEPGDLLEHMAGVSNDAATLVSQPYSLLVDLANGDHAVVIEDGSGDEVCADLGNVINGPYDEWMIDPGPLQPYGITVREKNLGGTLLAHTPLHVVPDETGGGRVAFSGRMLYWTGPGREWNEEQSVRVVWSLQMLTDWCDVDAFVPSEDAKYDTVKHQEELETFCAKPANRTPDQVKIVHAYDEEWYLTGLSVREDHGLEIAVSYEDPALDADPELDDSLWALSRGLGTTFVAGRDCDEVDENGICTGGNGLRDVGIAKERQLTIGSTTVMTQVADSTITERFGTPITYPGTPDEILTARWGIPVTAPLQVETYSFPHQDYVMHMAMTETVEVLDQFPVDLEPTLLFAREEHYRSVGLDERDGGLVRWSGGTLVLDADSQKLQADTLAALNWARYRYNAGLGPDGQIIGWEAFPLRECWDSLEIELTDFFNQRFPDQEGDVNSGWMVLARSYFVSLLNGMANRVQSGDQLIWSLNPNVVESDLGLAGDIFEAGAGYGSMLFSVVLEVAAEVYGHWGWHEVKIRVRGGDVNWAQGFVKEWEIFDLEYQHTDFLDSLGTSLKDYFVSDWTSVWKMGVKGRVAVGIAMVGVLAAVGITIYAATQAEGVDIAAVVLTGLQLVMEIQGAIGTVAKIVTAVKDAGGSLAKAASDGLAKAGSSIGKAFKSVAVVGLIIGVVITWGAFALQAGLSDLSTDELITSIVSAVISTVIAVLMFVIAQIPIVGWIITAVVGLIDAIVSLLCAAFLTDEQKSSWGGQWFCGGITGLITKGLTRFFYASGIMVVMNGGDSRWERVELSEFDQTIAYPHAGIHASSEMIYSVRLTNTLHLDYDAKNESGMGQNYFGLWDAETIKSSTFAYRWQTDEVDFHEDLDREQMIGTWQYVIPDGNHSSQYMVEAVRSEAMPLSEAGINQPQPLYLSEAYAVPKIVCVAVGCDVATARDTEHYNLGQNLKLDVLPSTLDDFYARVPKEGGYSLAWGQEGDLTFPVQGDLDGDGLVVGVDPDDRWWDTDADGLSDSFEMEIGSDPENPDSDIDGLSDQEELRVGTDPLRPDTDGDGLEDGEEVYHQDILDQNSDGKKTEWLGGWTFAYGLADDGSLLQTRVWSDGLDPDPDGDALTDFQEKTFGFNPRWPSDPSIMTFESIIREKEAGAYETSDSYFRPGDTLYYVATLKNQLYNRWAQGLLSTDFPQELVSAELLPEPFILYPQEEAVIEGDVPLSPAGTTGTYGLTQVAGALIADWAELAGGAQLWYQFEEPITSTVFIDRSGHQPPHDGVCSDPAAGSGCVPVKDDGVYGGALDLDGSAYVQSGYDLSKDVYSLSFWFKTAAADGGLFSVDSPAQPQPGTQIFLDGGQVCSTIPYHNLLSGLIQWETVCTSGGGYYDNQWHHVVQVYSDARGQSLFVDGALRAEGDAEALTVAGDVGVAIGRSLHRDSLWLDWTGFDGRFDDLRVYGERLSEGQVQAIFNQPVFHLKFDAASGWRDASAFGLAGSCATPDCPQRKPGVSGQAARFDGSDHLSYGPGPNLDLSGGRFTIAAWLYPQVYPQVERFVTSYNDRAGTWVTEDDRRTNHAQGILGRSTGQDNAYPTLERVGRKVQFGFGAQESGWPQVPYLSDDVLTTNAWNHVALTFDEGALELFVNGILIDQDPGTFKDQLPKPRTSLTVGRVNNKAVLTLDRMEPKSPSQFNDPAKTREDKNEYCWSFDGSEVHSQDGVGFGPQAEFDINVDVDVTEDGVLRLWEDDTGTTCGPAPDNNDEEVILENVREPDYGDKDGQDGLTFSSNYASADSMLYYYDDDGQGEWPEGALTLSYDNPSVPFYGRIDEVVIYNRVLKANDVKALFLSTSELMQLPLDEPPGETSFQTAGITREKGACSGDSCPRSGLMGRAGQAVLLDGDDEIIFGHGAANEVTTDLTMAAWINPRDLTGEHQILATARTASDNGYAFGTHGPRLRLTAYGVGDCVYPTKTLTADRWVHVAVTVQASGQPIFYVNGKRDTQVVCDHEIQADLDDLFLIGTATEAGSSHRIETFDGYIDDVRIWRPALGDAQIEEIYQSAPLLQLAFDEDEGANSFANMARYSMPGSCTADACPKAGTKGQLGLAVEFDGVDDRITVPDNNRLDLDRFSVGAWVLPTAIRDKPQPILTKDNSGAANRNYGLLINSNSMQVQYGFQEDDCSTWRLYGSAANLVQNQWNHVMMTYDGEQVVLYINGERDSHHTLSTGVCQNNNPLRIGRISSSTFSPFAGRIDQVTIHGQALARSEVTALYRYQAQWVEERQSHSITIDADLPTSELGLVSEYLPLQAVQMQIEAHDATSGVGEVSLLVNGTPHQAEPCLNASGDGLWCVWFDPATGGRKTLQTRAVDVAGNVQTPLPETVVYVDKKPPAVGSSVAAGTVLQARAHPTARNSWLVRLEGTIEDPAFGDGHPGSGLKTERVEVLLVADDGTRAGPAPQWAIVTGNQWTIDYQITAAAPDGPHSPQVAAQDQVGNQVTADLATVHIDATAPAAALDLALVPAGPMISDTIPIGGSVSDVPVPVRVEWTTGAGTGHQLGLSLVCSGMTLYAAEAGQFAQEEATYRWVSRLHRGSACQVQINEGSASGEVAVCGSQIASWAAGGPGAAFVADAVDCGPAPSVLGVDGAQLALASVLPGSPFHNPTALAGELLHLPFEESTDQTGSVRFHDISGNGNDGLCNGSDCPATGQIGHTGRAVRFDGVQTRVSIEDSADLNLGTGPLTLAFWVKSQQWDRGDLFSWRNSAGDEFSVWLDEGRTVQVYLTTDGSGGLVIADGGTFSRSEWHHVAIVRDAGGNWTAFVDGAPAGSGASGADLDLIDAGTPLWLGARRSDLGQARRAFNGWLDNVQLLGRDLSGQEVRELHLGAGPVLDLTFEDTWQAGGSLVYDQSGWQNDGLLESGIDGLSLPDLDNKTAAGIVGAHSIRLDGVDDALTVADDASLDLSRFSVGAWVRPQASSGGLQLLLAKQDPAGGQTNYALYLDRSSMRVQFSLHEGDCTTLHDFYSNGSLLPGQWSHVFVTYDGGQLALYLNGQLDRSEGLVTSVCHNGEPIKLGRQAGLVPFGGRLDDVHVYPRALSALEVDALYQSRWREVVVAPTGAGVTLGAWTDQVPAGLEGEYSLDLRGQDAGGHVDVNAGTLGLWQGEIDTLAPRANLTVEDLATSRRFTAVAQDWNLAQGGLTSPCSTGFATDSEYVTAAWYLAASQTAAGDPNRLYGLEAVCEVPYSQMQGEVGAVDTPALARGVDTSGNIACIADHDSGLQVIDVSEPRQPIIVATTSGPIVASDVAIAAGGAAGSPNLIVDSLIVEPTAPDINSPVTVTIVVSNAGSGPAWTYDTAVYLDTVPAVCDGGAGSWQSVNHAYLAAGSAVTHTFVHGGWPATTGHQFYAQTDTGCSVGESNEGDNTAGPAAVNPVAADLVLSSVEISPTNPVANQSFTVTVTVSNTGTTAAQAFTTSLYVDAYANLCDSGAGSWAELQTVELAPGASQALEFVHPGLAVTGTHFLEAQVDSACTIEEMVDANNLPGHISFDVVAEPLPDLLVTLLTTDPWSPLVSEPFVVTVTVENQGSAATGPFSTTVYTNHLPAGCGDSTAAWGTQDTTGLAVGASTTMTFAHPGLSASDWYTLYAFADSTCVITEDDETNNIHPHLFFVDTTLRPDLIVLGVTTDPVSPEANEATDINVLVKNQGLAVANLVEMCVYVNKPANTCDEGFPDWYCSMLPGSLAVGASATLSWTHTFTPSGDYTVTAQVDPACGLIEEREDNNISDPITVTVVPPTFPDLVVDSIEVVPPSPAINQPVTISITIRNQGDKDATGDIGTALYVDTLPDPSGNISGSWDLVDVTSLAVAATATVTFAHPGFATAGDYGLYGQADAMLAVAETDETNNESGPLTITVTSSMATAGEGRLSTKTLNSPLRAVVQATAAYTYAYVTEDAGGLYVFDITDPLSPTQVGSLALPGSSEAIAIEGNYAYIASEAAGMHIVDISNPASPGLLGTYPSDNISWGVAVQGSYAYLADGLAGLHVVNVSDPLLPSREARLDLPGHTRGVAVAGPNAYVAAGVAGLQVVNVSNASLPQVVGAYNTHGSANDVSLVGAYALVADGADGLVVVDVSNPANPLLARTLDTPGNAWAVQAVGDLAFVADYDQGLRIINHNGVTPQATACDTAGNCTTVEATTTSSQASMAAAPLAAPELSVSIAAPPALLASSDPVSATGDAASLNDYLKDLVVSVGGGPILNESWAGGTMTETIWSVDWTPPTDGQYLFRADASDHNGRQASATLTVTVDTLAPVVSIVPTVYTRTHFSEPGSIGVTGGTADAGGVTQVEFTAGSGSGLAALSEDGSTWAYPWPLGAGALPDGETFTVSAEAVDIVGHSTRTTETVTVDIVPPSGIELSLSTGGQPLKAYDTVQATAPVLNLEWTAGSDGSTIAGYSAGWTVQTTGTSETQLADYGPADPRQSTIVAGEGQKLRARVGSWDALSNEGWQPAGPIYADSPLTPDYVLLADLDGTYLGWLDHGCSLVGTDRRVARYATGGAQPDGAQELYASWNADALRLAWLGADWNTDGDLMIYLDTTAGGSTLGYNPYAAATAADLGLPPGMEADYLIWIQDGAVTLLLRWTGSEWLVDGPLKPGQFRLEPGLNDGHTDLYLPFADIGITSPASQSLDLVAMAIEGPATGAVDPLELWAVIPSANPVNSGRSLASGVTLSGGLALGFAIHWDNVGAGLCPNGSDGSSTTYLDVDLGANLNATPRGKTTGLPASTPTDPTVLLSLPATGQMPTAPGQEISYTVAYHNRGQDRATGVFLDVNALHNLELPDGDTAQHQTVLVPDIEAGARGVVTFRGFVNTGLSAEPWAAVEVGLHDSGHGLPGIPLARLWAQHAVDKQAPVFAGILQPGYLVGPGINPLMGYAFDASGVQTLTLEIEAPAGTSTLTCPDGTPQDGQWTCGWDVSGTNNDPLSVKLKATDGAGWTSGWGPSHPFMLDGEPPQLTFSLSTTQELGGSQIQDGTFGLYGSVTDNGGIAWVDVCLDGSCSPANLQLESGASPVTYEDVPGTPLAIGGGTTCGGGEMEIEFSVAEAFYLGSVSVGFVAEHAHRDDLLVELQSPSGSVVRLLEDDGWAGTHYQNYDLLLHDTAPSPSNLILGDHDAGPPYYQFSARPTAPLATFMGQTSAGIWKLRVCDLDPGAGDGAYHRSRLILSPLDTAAKAGIWSSQAFLGGDLDFAPQVIRVYGQDIVGNRTTDPISLTAWIDNVPPVITVSDVVSQVQAGDVQTVLSGTVSDGGLVRTVEAHVRDPEGASYRRQVQRSGDAWSFDLEGGIYGRYTVWIRAVDEAGNFGLTAPYAVDVPCIAANLLTPDIWAEPAPAPSQDLLLSATISNTGATVPAEMPVDFYAGEELVGSTTTSQPLGPGQAETVRVPWTVPSAGSWDVSVVLNNGGGGAAPAGLCAAPPEARQRISVRDVSLDSGWSLISSYVDPFIRDIEVVQRPIEARYQVIESYDGRPLTYRPGGLLDANTLHTFDGEHGYWIKALDGFSPTLRIAGQVLPDDHGISLDTGWNLVSYLPEQPLPVEKALASIDGFYTAVLGFEQGALSYYPDLDPGFNTLNLMRPMHGYWIHVTAPVTLRYRLPAAAVFRVYLPLISKQAEPPTTGTASAVASGPEMLPASSREMLPASRTKVAAFEPSSAAPAQATVSWVSYYGTASTADGFPLPAGTRILAVDPDGTLCGAVEMAVAGRYGLLPCYGDDPTTPSVDEGATAGDLIRIYVEGDLQERATATWTQPGDHWQINLGPATDSVRHWVYLPTIRTPPGISEFASGFDDGAGPEWSNPSTDTTPNGQSFLGQFGAEEVRLSLSGLTTHSQVTVTFDLYVIRSWDGSEMEVSEQVKPWVAPNAVGGIGPDIWSLEVVGGPRLLYTTFSNWDTLRYHQAYPDDYPEGHHRARTGAVENNGLGYTYSGPQDAVYRLSYSFDHTAKDLTLRFAAEGLQAVEDESWGLDNVEVTWR